MTISVPVSFIVIILILFSAVFGGVFMYFAVTDDKPALCIFSFIIIMACAIIGGGICS